MRERIRNKYLRGSIKSNPPFTALSIKPYIKMNMWKYNAKNTFFWILFDWIETTQKCSKYIPIANNKEYLIGLKIVIKSLLTYNPFKIIIVIIAPNSCVRKRGFAPGYFIGLFYYICWVQEII